MHPALSSPNRLLAATLIDWIGTGFYLAISAIFLTRSAGLGLGEVGLVLAVAGMVAFFGSVHVGRLGDRFGPRRVLLVLYVMRAAAFVGLAIVHTLGVTLVMLSVIALADQAASSMYQALANVMASQEERVGLMARMRVAINIGITLGTVPAGIELATQSHSFAPLLLGNAASYLLAGLIVATLPAGPSPAAPAARRRLLIPSPATAALIGINGLMSLWVVILNVGLPLWIVDATTTPRALVAILYGTSTVVAIFLQARVARLVSSYGRAAQAQRLAGILLALCCGCLAGSALVGGAAAAILLTAGVLCLSGGELLTVSSAWEVSFRLAPPGRSAEFFATYGLGRAGSQVAGPILITVAVLALGVPGWLALAGLFIIGGLITPVLAQRAYDHPLVLRKPPADPPAAGLPRGLFAVTAGPGSVGDGQWFCGADDRWPATSRAHPPMRVGIVGGSIAGCATAALLHRAGHDVVVFERSESDLLSRGAGIVAPTAAWQDMMAHGLIDAALPVCRADYFRFVTRRSGTGQQRWLGDVQLSFTLLNWAHLYQSLRRCVPDDLYRRASAVEAVEARPQGTTLHLRPGGSLDFDLVVCADGYRSMGRRLTDPGATPRYRGMVLWRGLLRESDIGVDALDGCAGQRVVYQGGHGIAYYVPGSGPSTGRGERLLMWGYYLQVPEGALSSVLVDDQERQQSSSVPFGKVHPEVRAGLESRLADLLPSSLFELVQQCGNSSIQAIYSVAARSYARDRLCLAGDAGAVFPPFAGSGVLRALANATSLAGALAGAPAVDDGLRRWSEAQARVAAQVMPAAERIERSAVFDMPDLAAMSTAATNQWMSVTHTGLPVTLPDV